ncbi:MAG: hypothetical protein RJB22_2197 [Pseudomonadota bacterium]
MAPITRICSIAALVLGATAVSAARPPKPTALSSYVQARIAEADGAHQAALKAYAIALKAEPANDIVALRTLRLAIDQGDRTLAIRAAESLAKVNALPQDGALLLVGTRLQAGDIMGASGLIDRLDKEQKLSFLLPVLRSWVGIASRDAEAAGQLGNATAPLGLGTSMTLEQRAFADLLAGRRVEALSLVRSAPANDMRSGVTRLTAAATLQKQGAKAEALAMLIGNDTSSDLARARITANRPLGGAIDTPVKGLAFFYARLASDLAREDINEFAMTLARYARFLDPTSPFIAVVEAQVLAANDFDEAALAALTLVAADDPYAAVAAETQLSLYQKLGRGDAAVALATRLAQEGKRAVDFTRLGDVLTRQKRYSEAAQAYADALTASNGRDGAERWGLFMLQGNALAQAGNWAAAEPLLREAVRLGPDQATALNYLGYSLLERRKNIDEAAAMIARAALLKPNDAAITDSLGWSYFLKGDYDRAVTTLEQAAIAEPTEPTIAEHLGDAYWRAGRRVAARYSWRAALLIADEDAAIARLKDKVDIGLTDSNQAR